jgi:ubiquinone biosynthesis protein UbiJ
MQNIFLTFIESALNRYLALDPESKDYLMALPNSALKIELQGLNLEFYLLITPPDIKISTEYLDTPNTIIRGTPISLLRMTFSSDRKQFFAEDISIEGDLELGQQIIELFDRLEIDWEECLAKKLGDAPAYHVNRAVNYLQKSAEKIINLFGKNVTEYIHEEKEWLPQRERLQDFFNEVDTLRMDTDRLAVKLKHLQQKLAEH